MIFRGRRHGFVSPSFFGEYVNENTIDNLNRFVPERFYEKH